MKKLLPFILLLPAFAHGTTLTVTSLADDGSAGTLRALCASAAGGDEIVFEREPLERLAQDGQLDCYTHEGFWQCMDTLRDKEKLEKLIADKQAPWLL